MITIPEVVENIIKKSPFLEEGLQKNIINYSSLARLIKPDIEKILFKKIQEGAIVMAIRRLSKKLKANKVLNNFFTVNTEMIVRSNLMEFTVVNSVSLIKNSKILFEKIGDLHRFFFTITGGVFETAIIVSQELEKEVRNVFKKEKIIHSFMNLSAITIKLPEANAITPGVYYFILKALAWEKINVIDVVSTYQEFTMIFEDKEVDKAFSILKKTLSI